MLKLIILSVLFFSIRSLPTHFGTLQDNTALDLYGNSQAHPAKRMMATGCLSNSDYKYPNGSCLSSCPDPHQIQMDQGSAFCNPPCPGQFFDTTKGTCLDSCERFFDRFEDGIRYCDVTAECSSVSTWYNPTRGCSPPCLYPLYNAGTLPEGGYDCQAPCSGRYFDVFSSCVDSCEAQYIRVEGDMTYCDRRVSNPAQCPKVFEYKYPNGSCSPSCPEPFYRDSDEDGYFECNPPCKQGQYFDYLQWICIDSCEPQYIRVEEGIIYCDPFTQCSSFYDYKYANGSCLDSCPSPGWTFRFGNGALFCDVPCPKGQYHDEKYKCVDSCDGEIKTRGEIRYCLGGSNLNSSEKSLSATVEIYLRYDISLADFNSQNYLAKFLALLSTFLADNSEIKITDIREGSTIIESQVTLKSGSQAEMKSKTAALNTKLTNAAKSKGLNLEGINVLNSKFSVVLPEENDDDGKSVKGLAIGLGVGVTVVAIVLGAYLLYRYRKKQRSIRIQKIRPSSEVDQRRNEEIGPQVQNSMSQAQAPQVNIPDVIEPKAEPFKAAKVELDLEKNQLSEKKKGVDLVKIEEVEEVFDGKPPQHVGNGQQEKEDQKSINKILDQIDDVKEN